MAELFVKGDWRVVVEAAQGVLLAQFKWALARASGLDNPIIRTSRQEMAYA